MPKASRYFDFKTDKDGKPYLTTTLDGITLLRLVLLNKGTAFSPEERAELGIEGLLPPAYNTLEQQIDRVYAGYRTQPTPIAKYQFLRSLQERHEILFYALLERHVEEMLPIVYTPTVGDAVMQFSALYQNPRGLSYSTDNIGRASAVAASYPLDDVRMIVATDSSAILGIGDQGYGGLAIPIGKLALYTVAGGVSPFHAMPVALDVGTDREDLRSDPFYLGVRRRRLRDEEYLSFIDAFVASVRARWPRAVIQWEDLSKDTAFAVLERYRDKVPSFNDDIQGTGAVALAGLISACKMKGERLRDQRVVIHGAGAGGIGVAWAIREGLVRDGLTLAEASARVLVLDSKGLLTSARGCEAYKRSFCQPREAIVDWNIAGFEPTLLETIRNARPTALIGLSGQTGAFTETVVKAMAKSVATPIIFPLSNPTSSCEALPEDVYRWTDGKAIVATGSPFAPVEHGGRVHPIGQGNNAFIFPGLGFGAIAAEAKAITDGMVLEAAYALADYVEEHHLAHGRIYPPIGELREASVHVAARVIARAIADGQSTMLPRPIEELEQTVRSRQWKAEYLPIKRA
ncbi:MAG: NAD-dependent malic enzyme [Deltaproteobacteria bacterium]|nr:NAD-dependent malic enzyme [Deltaproteobacteria bacterium]